MNNFEFSVFALNAFCRLTRVHISSGRRPISTHDSFGMTIALKPILTLFKTWPSID